MFLCLPVCVCEYARARVHVCVYIVKNGATVEKGCAASDVGENNGSTHLRLNIIRNRIGASAAAAVATATKAIDAAQCAIATIVYSG